MGNKTKGKTLIYYRIQTNINHKNQCNGQEKASCQRDQHHTVQMITLASKQFKADRIRDEVATYHKNSQNSFSNTFSALEIPTITTTPLIDKWVPYL